MKNTVKILSLALLIFVTSISYGQSIKSYELKMPAKIIAGGGSVFVKALENGGKLEQGFGESFGKALKTQLDKETIGQKSGTKCFNPWYTTKLYKTADGESQADFIISGSYAINGDESKTSTVNSSKEKLEGLSKPVTYYYYSYTASSKASLVGSIVVTKKDGSKTIEIPLKGDKSKSETGYLKKESVASVSSFARELSKKQIATYQSMFSPTFDEKNYRFKNVKTKDKVLKKEFKANEKAIKNQLKADNLHEAAKLYLELESKEKSENLSYNIGMCYELIGNFTKALEYYNNAGDKGALKDINELIKLKTTFESLGLKVEEGVF
ncbi:MAG: tetratricopeptide repeat protein [Salinivirgaceae bacterium]|nr:tetratricopeptide repeat protein [Salinivirgaceae bacterium]